MGLLFLLLAQVNSVQDLPVEKQRDYYLLLAFVALVLLCLFVLVALGRFMRTLMPQQKDEKKQTAADPWTESGRRLQVESELGDDEADFDDADDEGLR